jgi:hypothetical protein
MCEDRLLFVSVDFHFSLCKQQHSKCEWTIRLVCPPSFRKLPNSSNPPPKKKNLNGVKTGHSNIFISVTNQNYIHIHMNIFSRNDWYVTSQRIDLFFWITLYIAIELCRRKVGIMISAKNFLCRVKDWYVTSQRIDLYFWITLYITIKLYRRKVGVVISAKNC